MSLSRGDSAVFVRRRLEWLQGSLQDRLAHLRQLPIALQTALRQARALAVSPESCASLRALAAEVAGVLESFPSEQLTPRHARELARAVAPCHHEARRLEDRRLANALHSTVEQHVGLAGADLRPLVAQIEDAISALARSGPLTDCLGQIGDLLERAKRDASSEPLLVELLSSISSLVTDLPTEEPAYNTPGPVAPARFFHVLVVEDNPTWQSTMLRAVEQAGSELGPSVRLEGKAFDNAYDALRAFRSIASASSRGGESQTLAVLDLGLPANPGEAEAARGETLVPERATGYRLLEEIRAYGLNIPVIVLTAPSHLLEDQLRVCSLGIDDCDYLVKTSDKAPELVQSIKKLVLRRTAHQVAAWKRPTVGLSVDQIPLELQEMPARTLYSLCSLSTRTPNRLFGAAEIVEELDEQFGAEFDYLHSPENSWERALVMARQRGASAWGINGCTRAANVMRIWARCKQDVGGDTIRALRRFAESRAVYRDAIAFLQQSEDGRSAKARGEHLSLDARLLADRLDDAFGGLKLDVREGYDLENIARHVHRARIAIHQAFQRAHRFIDPRREILVGEDTGSGYGYRVLGAIEFRGEDAAASRHVQRALPSRDVLVVEDDLVYRRRIRSLLEGTGFTVHEATNLEDAVAEARLRRPGILSLDLNIPATGDEHDLSAAGDVSNGIQVLETLRNEFPGIGVVVPTSEHARDELRERLARLGVAAFNLVPKGAQLDGVEWEGHYLLTIFRLRDEIEDGQRLPAAPPWRCPIVQVLEDRVATGGDLTVRVNGRESRFRGKEARLVHLLLRNTEQPVPFLQLDQEVWGHPIKPNTRNQKINDVRKKIRLHWLGFEPGADERPELQVLQNLGEALILHAHAEGPEIPDDDSAPDAAIPTRPNTIGSGGPRRCRVHGSGDA